MKKRNVFFASLFAILTGIASFSHAGRQDFTVHNRTGVTVWKMYVSAANASGWEEDVLHDNVIYHGGSFTLRFSNYESRRYWDIKIVDRQGNTAEWRNVDLLTTSNITLYQANGSVWADFD